MAIEVHGYIIQEGFGSMALYTDDRATLNPLERAVVCQILVQARLGMKIPLAVAVEIASHSSRFASMPSPVQSHIMIECMPYGLTITSDGVVRIGFTYHKALKFSDGREIMGDEIASGRDRAEANQQLRQWLSKT